MLGSPLLEKSPKILLLDIHLLNLHSFSFLMLESSMLSRVPSPCFSCFDPCLVPGNHLGHGIPSSGLPEMPAEVNHGHFSWTPWNVSYIPGPGHVLPVAWDIPELSACFLGTPTKFSAIFQSTCQSSADFPGSHGCSVSRFTMSVHTTILNDNAIIQQSSNNLDWQCSSLMCHSIVLDGYRDSPFLDTL